MSIELSFPFRVMSKSNEKITNRQGRVFLTKKFKDFEKSVKEYAKAQYKGDILTCNIKMEIWTMFRNKVRPDAFNIPKSIADALQGTVYKNDKQITEGQVYVFTGGKDRFWVKIEEKEDL